MANSSLAAQAVAGGQNALEALEPLLTVVAAAGWCLPLLLLILPLWRLVRRRQRPLDALWAVLLLGVVNRLISDFGGVPAGITHLSAALMAAVLTIAIRSYQNADA